MIRAYQSGFAYLTALLLVAMMGAALASTATLWSTAQQRENERELLFVGDQFRQAIRQYYESSPGAVRKFPGTLDVLLKDERQLATKRYLRKIFFDPMTRSKQWGEVKSSEGGIMGVYSLSEKRPLKMNNFRESDKDFSGKIKYSEWRFIYIPSKRVTPR